MILASALSSASNQESPSNTCGTHSVIYKLQQKWDRPESTIRQLTRKTTTDITELSVDRNFYLRSSVNGQPTNKPKSEGVAEDSELLNLDHYFYPRIGLFGDS